MLYVCSFLITTHPSNPQDTFNARKGKVEDSKPNDSVHYLPQSRPKIIQTKVKLEKVKLPDLFCAIICSTKWKLCVQIHADVLHDAIAEADYDDEQSGQSPLEGRDQLSKDQQARG